MNSKRLTDPRSLPKVGQYPCKPCGKRRGRDSNPRDGLTPPTRFPIALLRPTRTPLRKGRTGVYQKRNRCYRGEFGPRSLLALLYIGCVLLLGGAGCVAQGEGGEEEQRQGGDGHESTTGPEVVLGGVDPVVTHVLVLDEEGGQEEAYSREEPDDGDDQTTPCLRRHQLLTLPSSPALRAC